MHNRIYSTLYRKKREGYAVCAQSNHVTYIQATAYKTDWKTELGGSQIFMLYPSVLFIIVLSCVFLLFNGKKKLKQTNAFNLITEPGTIFQKQFRKSMNVGFKYTKNFKVLGALLHLLKMSSRI